MTFLRRLDHVALAVRDSEAVATALAERFQLQTVHREELTVPPVRLTYLDCGNCYLQLVEPLRADAAIAQHIARHGEGLHHVCFAVEELEVALSALGCAGVAIGQGWGRRSAFVPGTAGGAMIELTELRRVPDLDSRT